MTAGATTMRDSMGTQRSGRVLGDVSGSVQSGVAGMDGYNGPDAGKGTPAGGRRILSRSSPGTTMREMIMPVLAPYLLAIDVQFRIDLPFLYELILITQQQKAAGSVRLSPGLAISASPPLAPSIIARRISSVKKSRKPISGRGGRYRSSGAGRRFGSESEPEIR